MLAFSFFIMKKEVSIKEELVKLTNKYELEKSKIIKKCNHNWIDNGYESDKYHGTQYYKCSICGAIKGEGF